MEVRRYGGEGAGLQAVYNRLTSLLTQLAREGVGRNRIPVITRYCPHLHTNNSCVVCYLKASKPDIFSGAVRKRKWTWLTTR